MRLNFMQSKNPLVQRVASTYWGMLGLTILLESVVLAVGSDAKHDIRHVAAIGLLTLLSLLSVHWPVEKSRTTRVALCVAELLLLSAASIFGIYRWIWPLYLVLVARASLILDQDDLPKIVVAYCVSHFGWYFVHSFVTLPMTAMSQMVATSMIGALMMTASTCLLVAAVAVLMRSLINEQHLRQETERLARENEVLATELERTRIAREIHDTVGHSLTSLKIQLELAGRLLERGDDRAKGAVSQAEQLAARSLTDTRVALQSIRNADFNFEKALSELARELRSSGTIEVAIECDQFPNMSNAVSYQLYRVIQECMTNTLKHAGAKQVTVRLTEDEGKVTLAVRDDGAGFDSDATTDGFGLKGLRERISSIQGHVSVSSKKGIGTEVSVSVPHA